MSSNERCPRCGVRQNFDVEASLCPGCLIAGVLNDPEHIGDHDILAKLGQGGMGVVYSARHRSIGRIVALKVISAGALFRFLVTRASTRFRKQRTRPR